MNNLTHSMQMLQQMQQLSQFVSPPNLHLSEEDVVRIAMKMKELLSADIKAMVNAAVGPLRTEVNEVKASLAKVQQELKQATVRNDDLEQYSRRACLRIAGINETSNEDVAKKVMELAHRVNANITIQDIDRAHRGGKPSDEATEDISCKSRIFPTNRVNQNDRGKS